ncbi:hypothetical protein CTAYLR_000696 [Chrysophaeum taylorii]|uniref:VDE lipocalin domain-containing protein n=1 Tax=Chrysophaeum taylorii TaxID=2483200 RepID=A0AAD7UAB2_9STRA|nr:hypothetical protein CTAYLR_000696 [Chrysophaeum taylorii]
MIFSLLLLLAVLKCVAGFRVLFLAGEGKSPYGATSPCPEPEWHDVASQLAARLRVFDERIDARVSTNLRVSEPYDVVVALGVDDVVLETRPTCLLADPAVSSVEAFAGDYAPGSRPFLPWSPIARGKRVVEQAATLLARASTEDSCYAVLLALHALVGPIPVVAADINPSWDKGFRNILEFAKMIRCCGPEIFRALTDPPTKKAVDLLNSLDLRDQVGSYRVIVSTETEELEAFSLCILQQNNCFNADAEILTRPAVPALAEWRGRPLDDEASRDILVGHFPELTWSWKIVCGANPAYDAFPMQHQIFYPARQGLWYDPVFCVETIDGTRVWTKRHYRCVKRGMGLWTLTTLDNGVVSKEHWTIVDCEDDLSWAVLYYSGAAKAAGQSYQGALLCSRDGKWPDGAHVGTSTYDRIRDAFGRCGLELFELYGHGPPIEGRRDASFMWNDDFLQWAADNPPPLDPIGDISIMAWKRAQRRLLKTTSL